MKIFNPEITNKGVDMEVLNAIPELLEVLKASRVANELIKEKGCYCPDEDNCLCDELDDALKTIDERHGV